MRVVLAVVTAAVAALIAMLVVTLATAPEEAPSKKTPSRPVTRSVWSAPSRSPSLQPAPGVEPRPAPALPPVARDPNTVPKPADVERKLPGFQKRYDDAFMAAQARGDARVERRCLTSLPDSVKEVRWDTIETFQPSANGRRLVRTAIELIPAAEEMSPFTKCLAEASRSSLEIEMPEGTAVQEPVEVHNGGIVYINDYTPEYLAQEVKVLRQRVEDPALTEDGRAMLQDHLELWECYLQFGMSRRRECLSR